MLNIHLFHDLIPGHRVVYKPAVFSFGPSRGIRRLALMLSGIARPLQLVYVRSLVTGSSFQKLLLKHLAAQIKCAGHLTLHYGANKKIQSSKELMLSNCGVGEGSCESFGLQGDQTSQS